MPLQVLYAYFTGYELSEALQCSIHMHTVHICSNRILSMHAVKSHAESMQRACRGDHAVTMQYSASPAATT